MSFYIGLMSGTSMDGIDAALLQIPSNTLVHGLTKKYSEEVKAGIECLLNDTTISLASLCQLNTLIGREFAKTTMQLLQETAISAQDVVAIGSHGQTVCHDTSGTIPYTLQLGCGHTIASLTNITVVADFRTRDLVNGGQGAPFAPLYHQELFADRTSPLAVVNIGGIANITFLAPGQATKGWDVGPGNCLMDAWIHQHQGKTFDQDGSWAMEGELIAPLLNQLLSDPFFESLPPKSIGKEYFSLSWLAPHLKKEYTPINVQTTLSTLTAHSIAAAVIKSNSDIQQLYLCGGGTHNIFLHKKIADLLPNIEVKSIADTGKSPDYLEAMMFAWLAYQTINYRPVNMAEITGSKGPAILGAIYPR